MGCTDVLVVGSDTGGTDKTRSFRAANRFTHIYRGTSTAETLLQRANWQHLERITHEGKALSIYEKALEWLGVTAALSSHNERYE